MFLKKMLLLLCYVGRGKLSKKRKKKKDRLFTKFLSVLLAFSLKAITPKVKNRNKFEPIPFSDIDRKVDKEKLLILKII